MNNELIIFQKKIRLCVSTLLGKWLEDVSSNQMPPHDQAKLKKHKANKWYWKNVVTSQPVEIWQ